jgi:lipopolysaccharide export system permease protein
LLAVAIVLFFIFLSNKLVRYLADVASGELPGDVIFVMLSLVSVRYFIMMLPLAFYLSILLLFGRLYRDHEMAAMASCGIGPVRLYRSVFFVALPLTLFAGWMTLYVVPMSAKLEVQMLQKAQEKLEMTGISPGQFRESRDGKRTIYVEKLSPGKKVMENVFIRVNWKDRPVMMSASVARMVKGERSGEFFLELQNGTRYEGEPGTHEFRKVEFEKHRILVKQPHNDVREAMHYARPSETLWVSMNSIDQAEMQWRLSLPLSIMILSVLAVPLSKVKPRQGQYGKLFVALLLYILYVNLLAVAKTWVAKGVIPVFIGVWWVHLLVLVLALFLLKRQMGYAWSRKKKLARKVQVV